MIGETVADSIKCYGTGIDLKRMAFIDNLTKDGFITVEFEVEIVRILDCERQNLKMKWGPKINS